MNRINLTFGIPVYNAEKYIIELLKCFKDTKYFTYEVIIVDDGSTDNSYEICKNYNNKNFKVYHKKNEGVSATRNFIIDKANGEWITFIDSDDLINFDKYAALFIKIMKNEYDYHVGIRKQKHYNLNSNKYTYLIENEIINSPVDKFYKLEIVQKHNIKFNTKYSLGEDLLFNLHYLKHSKNVNYYFGEGMYIIRVVNQDSLTHKYRKDKFEELMSVNNECIKLFSNDKKVLKSLEYIRVKNCISCIKDIYIFPGKINKPKEYINKIRKNKKMQFALLNSLSTTLVYYFWYFVPNSFKLFIIRNKYSK
ncbi:MAG: glycosyltransferase [Bacilli bacterium]|nr:glycosyltransferase [Bacilli bacterium]